MNVGQDSHAGPLAIIAIIGTLAIIALIFAGLLAMWDKDLQVVITFLGVCTTVLALLAPSPLSKLPPATPSPEPPVEVP